VHRPRYAAESTGRRAPVAFVLGLALLVGLAVALAPSAPQASAQVAQVAQTSSEPAGSYERHPPPPADCFVPIPDGPVDGYTTGWEVRHDRPVGDPCRKPDGFDIYFCIDAPTNCFVSFSRRGSVVYPFLVEFARWVPGPPTTPTPEPTPEPVEELVWTPCGPAGRGLECATLELPMDAADPAGEQVQIALNRVRATDTANRIGSLVLNPGGPGGSGTQFLEDIATADDPGLLVESLGARVRERFDIVGFDPRGVGRSRPLADCLTVEERDAARAAGEIPYTDAAIEAMSAAEQAFGTTCQERVGSLLRFMSTTTVARDLESIRAALGDEKLSFLGFSYGTRIGATYAALHPDRVRVMALDGAVSLDVSAAASQEADRRQMLGFQRSLDAFLESCRTRPECTFGRSTSPAAALDELVFGTLAGGGTLPTAESQPLTQALALEAVIGSLYSQWGWERLETALEQVEDQGVADEMLVLADNFAGRTPAGYQPGADTISAVNCVDRDRPGTDVDEYRARYQAWSAESRMFGGFALFALRCGHWPVDAAERFTGPFTAAGAPPIVVVGTRNDPSTPYAEAEAMAATLSSGVLVTAEGYDHTAYMTNGCVQDAVEDYLVNATPPAAGTTCPVPAASAASSALHALLPASLPAPVLTG
jgi:pimeloyl-ACP methyl ester carboxylesterase